MIELSIPAHSLKEWTRALTCLTKIGDDIDISISHEHGLKLSAVNSSRSGWGMFNFEKDFFSSYQLEEDDEDARNEVVKFCVVGKALLAPFRPRTAATIESCTLSLTEDKPASQLGIIESNKSRLVVRLHCEHKVIKTHRLVYSAASLLYANAKRTQCDSFWVASSRILKEWTDHFHLRTGGVAGGTDEISFYCGTDSVKIKTHAEDIIGGQNTDDALNARPYNTELVIDVAEFDTYNVTDEPLITFALREFKAIIAVADALSVPLSAAFSQGGRPFLIELKGDCFNATFVIATNDFDSDHSRPCEKKPTAKQKEQKIAVPAVKPRNAVAGPSNGGKKATPLFNPASPTPSPAQQLEMEEEEEYGFDAVDLGEDDFAAMDLLSQVPATATARGRMLVPDSTKVEEEEEGMGYEEEDSGVDMSGMGPTQRDVPHKKAKWNLIGD